MVDILSQLLRGDFRRSYIYSCFIPALLFLFINLFIFQGLFHPLIGVYFFSDKLIFGFWLVFFVLVVSIGFFLFSMTNQIVRFYKGEFLPTIISRALC